MEQESQEPARGTAPVEASALTWRKSTRSVGNGNCVEAAKLSNGHLLIRDSKDKTGPMLAFTPSEWRAFIDGVKDGEFDSI